jgi:hypothetical protein
MVKKTVKSEAQNQCKKTIAAEKHFTSAMASFSLESNGSLEALLY